MSAGRLLVVDDSAINRALLDHVLAHAGYTVRTASNGEEALAAVKDELPETILLDVQMPGMSGYEVCARLKRDPRWRLVPVIFISALDDVAEKVKGFEAGGADYVTKPFEPPEVLARVGSQIALYRLPGIVHRDVKPHNIFLHREGGQEIVKVVDFGIAKLLDDPPEAEGVTQRGSLIGTPEYMAPERLLGRDYDHRSDIYSLGVLLYFMLAAAMPFPHDKPPGMIEMVQSHLTQKPRPLETLARPNVPPSLTAMAMRALSAEPASRPSLREIAATLSFPGGDPNLTALPKDTEDAE